MPDKRPLTIVSNRGPGEFTLDESGNRVVRRGGGGLVTALSGLVSHRKALWIASAMTDEDITVAEEAKGEAVETEIDKHYAEQLVALGDSDPELSAAILDFQAEELEHKATAIAAGAEETPGYPVMSALIRLGCKVAIATAKRI